MKHPVFQNRYRIALWWLIWVLMALGQLFLYNYVFKNYLKFIIPDVLISFTVYSGLSLVIWYPFRYFNTRAFKLYSVVINIVFTGAASLYIWLLFSKYILILIINNISVFDEYWNATFLYRLGSGIFIYGLVILAYYLIVSLSDLAERKAQEARLESVLKETELKMLRSQINPHFLFNTLNSVSALTISDPEKAREMIVKLSDFMRYALSRKDEQLVTLRSELDSMRVYLDIEKVRFGERLQYREYIDEKCLDIQIPILLLQPLYENAIKYGVHESNDVVNLETIIKCENELVEITIRNNFDKNNLRAKGTGTGLTNVIKRLELAYGNRASLKTDISGNIFTVTLYIPCK
ncbi:MAG TPA: histidine kinase [Bacteroidales bacterium]|nr:histidine kinase [Bacteroidales bacterium]